MERLTDKIGNTNCVKDCGSNCKYGFQYCRKEDWGNCQTISDVIDKLADYENLEERGRLVKLPCKVGDTVYYFSGGYYKNIKNWKITPIKVTEFNIKVNKSGKLIPLAMIANGTRYPMSSIGKTVFLTKSEVEAKLKELRGGEDESSN